MYIHETFDYVKFRRDPTMFKRAWHCDRWSVIFASGHTIGVKSEKSEDLEYLAEINYEILEYMFWNKANCHIKFSPNG